VFYCVFYDIFGLVKGMLVEYCSVLCDSSGNYLVILMYGIVGDFVFSGGLGGGGVGLVI